MQDDFNFTKLFDRELRFAQGPRNSFFSGNSSSHLFNFELILSFKDLELDLRQPGMTKKNLE